MLQILYVSTWTLLTPFLMESCGRTNRNCSLYIAFLLQNTDDLSEFSLVISRVLNAKLGVHQPYIITIYTVKQLYLHGNSY
jgi:hypothetical protein